MGKKIIPTSIGLNEPKTFLVEPTNLLNTDTGAENQNQHRDAKGRERERAKSVNILDQKIGPLHL